MKRVVILYGPPGSGKGTQANLLANKFGMIHFDTGKFLESIWYDPKRQKEKLVVRERKNFEAGKLNTPSVVAGEVIREIKKVAAARWGLIFSGSPRTLYEAQKEYPVLEKLYGRKNILIFLLELPESGSIKRNSARMVCRNCGYLLLTAFFSKHPKYCPVCGGSFYKRKLDNPAVIKVRLKEYRARTLPIIDFVKKKGYRIVKIDASPAPYKVMEEIYGHIQDARRN